MSLNTILILLTLSFIVLIACIFIACRSFDKQRFDIKNILQGPPETSLKNLKRLYDAGGISEEEYQTLRNEILSKL